MSISMSMSVSILKSKLLYMHVHEAFVDIQLYYYCETNPLSVFAL